VEIQYWENDATETLFQYMDFEKGLYETIQNIIKELDVSIELIKGS